MKITFDNYEAYYLDYLEGNLNQQDAETLSAFLLLHPELQLLEDELPTLAPILETQLPTEIHTKIKAIPTSETEFSELAIGKIEGLLNEVEQAKLESFIEQNKRYENEFKLYKKTRLVADTTIIYPKKSALLKGRILPIKPIITILAAASVGVFIYLNLNTNNPNTKQDVAQVIHRQTHQKTIQTKHIENQNEKIQLSSSPTTNLNSKHSDSTLDFSNNEELTLPSSTYSNLSTTPVPEKDSIIQTQISQIKIEKTQQISNPIITSKEVNKNLFTSSFSETFDNLKELKDFFGIVKLTKVQKEEILAETNKLHERISNANLKAITLIEKYKQSVVDQFNAFFTSK